MCDCMYHENPYCHHCEGKDGVTGEGKLVGCVGVSAPCYQQTSSQIGRPMLSLVCVLIFSCNEERKLYYIL